MGKRRRFPKLRLFPRPRLHPLGKRVLLFVLKSQLLTLFLVLCVVGFWAGSRVRPVRVGVPYEELFENLSVLSYRESPGDTSARFVVQLSASGRAFSEYDLDARTFGAPARGRDYRRAISGTRYPALQVRGHVERGFWLELPDSPVRALLPDQFNELYQTTLGYMKPVSIFTSVLGTLSGYSIGYRLGNWSGSLANPAVQKRVLTSAAIGRLVAREAWRRVLLEPVVTVDEGQAGRFVEVQGTQRVYTNFVRLALDDSDGFIPREVARLDTLGHTREAHAMLAFTQAVRRAAQDTCDLGSSDFAAIENWASLLDRHGHWATDAIPPPGEERMKYLGVLSWYGLAPPTPGERRIWVGPRMLVREAGADGFVADDLPLTRTGCPVSWRPWLRHDGRLLARSPWTAQWMGASREFAPLVDLAHGVGLRLRGFLPH